MSDQQKAIYGLVGYPVSHSLSPLMHNTAFDILGVDAVYDLFSLEENQLDAFFNDLRQDSSAIFGLNVTVPYKEKVVQYVDSMDPFAQKANAINTIVISNKRKLTGFNTDGPGFLTHITELGFQPKDKNVSILGAGGASRALIATLCIIPDKPRSIKVFDIDNEKAQYLIADLKQRIDMDIVSVVNSIDDLDIRDAQMLINATPLGMKDCDPCPIEQPLLHENLFVYDLVYNPKETVLLKMAKEKGAKTANGLGMLFYQGVLAFQHWADIELDPEIKEKMRDALEKGLQK